MSSIHGVIKRIIERWGPGRRGGVPVSHIPLIILKISHIPKINMGNIPKIQESIASPNPSNWSKYPVFTKISRIPLSFWPISLYPLPGPQRFCMFDRTTYTCTVLCTRHINDNQIPSMGLLSVWWAILMYLIWQKTDLSFYRRMAENGFAPPPPWEFCRHILSCRELKAESFKRCLHSVLRGVSL